MAFTTKKIFRFSVNYLKLFNATQLNFHLLIYIFIKQINHFTIVNYTLFIINFFNFIY